MEEQKEQETKRSLFAGLNIPQILAGALSAITVAFALSKLGVSGTLIGAGVGSVLGAFGTTVYTQTLDKSKVIVQKVARPVAIQRSQDSNDDTELVLVSAGSLASGEREQDDDTITMSPARNLSDTREIGPLPLIPEGDEVSEEDEPEETQEAAMLPPWYRRLNWKSIAVLAAVSLALALAVLSLYEVKTGTTLSGEKGTTIERVVVYRDNPDSANAPEPTPTPSVVYIIEGEGEGADYPAKESGPAGSENGQYANEDSEEANSQNDNDQTPQQPTNPKPDNSSSIPGTKPGTVQKPTTPQNPPAVKDPVVSPDPVTPAPGTGSGTGEDTTTPGGGTQPQPEPEPSPTPANPPAEGIGGGAGTTVPAPTKP